VLNASHDSRDVQRFRRREGGPIWTGRQNGPQNGPLTGPQNGRTSRGPPEPRPRESPPARGRGEQRRQQLDRRGLILSKEQCQPGRLQHDVIAIALNAPRNPLAAARGIKF
jgi:hypothetical protein